MWFKNLLVYRLTQQLDIGAEALEIALANRRARSCGATELSTYGFVAPLGKGEDAPLVHAANGFLLIAARKEERILPGSVVRDALQEKVEEIEEQQMRKVYKKERDQLKDEIVQTLLPRAFLRRASTFAALDLASGLIYVNASSPSKAEDLLSTVREVLGSLPVRPLCVKIAPSATFTDWMKTQQATNGIVMLDDCELRDTHEDGGIIRCKRQDLGSDEIQNHLAVGKLVTKLRLAWEDKLSFTLDDKMAIKGLRFEDLLQEQAAQDGGDDALAQADASFTLMMMTLSEFLPRLIEALGGEDIPAGIGADAEVIAKAQPSAADAPWGDAGASNDDLYDQAVAYVQDSRSASVAAVQRHLKIGYDKAVRLMERLEAGGIVSPVDAFGQRVVLGGVA